MLNLFDGNLKFALFGENNLENIILYDCLHTKRKRLLAAMHGTFDVASMDEGDVVLRQFKFTKEDLPHLRSGLLIESIVGRNTKEGFRSLSWNQCCQVVLPKFRQTAGG